MLPKGLISPLIETLVESLQVLPGVGPKTAQRMAYHLLQHNRQNGIKLSEALCNAMQNIQLCGRCRQFTEDPLCPLCMNTERNSAQCCVVESPTDMLAIEQAGVFRGYYFILHGRLSPLDGMGPEQLGLSSFFQILKEDDRINEVILACSTTIEGEATAHYLTQYLKQHHANLTCSRIAHGIPSGGDVAEMDSNTLMRALKARTSTVVGEVG